MSRAAWLVLAALVACGGKKAPKDPVGVDQPAAAQPSSASAKKKAPPLVVPSHVVATVGEKSLGPFLTRRGDVLMAAYVGQGESGRRIVSVPLAPDGATRGDAQVVAPIPSDATALVLRATGGASAGFVAAWTSLTDRGEALSIAGIDDQGLPRGPAIELARTNDDITWVDVVATPRGAICVWAEETRGGSANVLAVALEPDGKMHGVPARVARGVSGWQIVPAGEGAGLALVFPGPEPKKGAKQVHAGTLEWIRLDADARPSGARVVVAPKPTVSGDVDVVRFGPRYLFAWTDRTGSDPEVTTATVSEDGKVEAPQRPLAQVGGSALVALVAGPAGGLVAWDAPNRRGRPTRRVHLAHIDPLGGLDGRTAAVDVVGRGAPEIAPTDGGFALVATARMCEKDAACGADAPVLPTFVRFDANLTPTQTEPLRFGEDRTPAQLAWNLACLGERCAALTAEGDPATIRSVDVAPRAGVFAPPVAPVPPPDAPRLGVITTLAQGEPYADLAVTRVGEGTLVAMVTSALDGSDAARKPGEPIGATLSVRALDGNGAPIGPASTVSTRALTIGGVAIAPAATPQDGAAVAWVAREGGDPQVHVTRVDKRGKRQNDVLLTTAKGDAADVAIAWAEGGWVVAWVDSRDGNGEVYATKVGPDLQRIAREERITNAPGDASDVTLLVRGKDAWVAWADPRESPADGFADVYVAKLSARDAKRTENEVRVLASAAHSRSPVLTATDDAVVLGWIEEAPTGADAATSTAHGAMIARLDDKGRPRGAIAKVRGAGGGFPTALALDPAPRGSSLRGVVARATKEQLDVDAIELDGKTDAARAFPLLTLDGPTSLDVSLALDSGAVYYNDDGPEPGDRRVRRATILWRR